MDNLASRLRSEQLEVAATKFRSACRHGQLATVEQLLATPHLLPDPNATNDDDGGFNGLLFAAYEGKIEIVKRLLADPRVYIDARSRDKKTSLIWAAYKGHLEVVDFLLNDGRADPNLRSSSQSTALCYAVSQNKPAIAQRLLKDPRVDTEIRGLDKQKQELTPFLFACCSQEGEEGKTECLRVMLESERGDINYAARVRKTERTGLHLATAANQRGAVQLLLSFPSKIDRTLRDGTGKLAVELATDERIARLFAGTAEPSSCSTSTSPSSMTTSPTFPHPPKIERVSTANSVSTTAPAPASRIPSAQKSALPPRTTSVLASSDANNNNSSGSASIKTSRVPAATQRIVTTIAESEMPTTSTNSTTSTSSSSSSSRPSPSLPARPTFISDSLISPNLITLTTRILGEGGYGTVYEGLVQGKRMAVKKLRGDPSEGTLREFEKEVKTWDGIRHENILPLRHYTLSPPMIITDLIEEGDLLRYLNSHSYNHDLALGLLTDVSSGMAHLHQQNIVHGDLKPKNVLVSHGRAKICDFGLARVRADISESLGLSTTQSVKGTDVFMAPEMLLDNARPIKRSDVYAFAMMAFQVLNAGVKPWPEAKGIMRLWNVMRKVEKGERPEKPALITASEWGLIERCWAQDPGSRPKFDEVLVELGKLQRAAGVPRRASSLGASGVKTVVVVGSGDSGKATAVGRVGKGTGAAERTEQAVAIAKGLADMGQRLSVRSRDHDHAAPFTTATATSAIAGATPTTLRVEQAVLLNANLAPNGLATATATTRPISDLPPYRPVLSTSPEALLSPPPPFPLIGPPTTISPPDQASLLSPLRPPGLFAPEAFPSPPASPPNTPFDSSSPLPSSSSQPESETNDPSFAPGKTCRVSKAFAASLSGQISLVSTDIVTVESWPSREGWVVVKRITPRRKQEVGKVPVDRLIPHEI